MMNAKELELKLSDALQREDVLKEKLAVSQREFRAADATIENLQMQVEKLASENAGDASVKITRFRVYNGDENVEQYDEGAYVIYEDAMEIIKELSRRLRSVSAENILLKSAHPQPFGPEMMKALDAYEKHQDEVPETGMLDAFFILRDSIRIDTTATDDFLAEVRAQIAEEALKIMGNFTSDECGDGVYIAIKEFAENLRKGVQS